MVFCAYCGKSFTRKEHLERHIPSHTNVKPHRCSACQLSFARRDLLQRHHSTYHEARDPMEPLPGGVPTVAGRTPIACQNCANAKTGCDKRVPCSRCAEKNLPCAARFARRSSKAALRAAQASANAALSAQTNNAPAPAQQPTQSLPTPFMEVDNRSGHKPDSPSRSPMNMSLEQVTVSTGMDMCIQPDAAAVLPQQQQQQPMSTHHQQQQQQQQQQQASNFQHSLQPLNPLQPFSPGRKPSSQLSPQMFSSPPARMDGLDEFMGFGGNGEFVGTDGTFQDLIWADYPMDMDMYTNALHISQPGDLTATALVPPFTASTELSDISSNSEPMTTSSSQGSIHTRCTSILSGSGDFDNLNGMTGSGHSHGHHSGGNSPFKHTSPRSAMMNIVFGPDDEVPEFEVVLASEAAWPLARCTPSIFSATCPRTAIVHLECLEQKSKQEGTWANLEQYLKALPNTPDSPQVVPLASRSRDKMLAITQSFLHKALDIHRGSLYPKGISGGAASPGAEFNFLVLPPSRILEYFLRSFVQSLAIYYPLVVGGVVDPNEMLDNSQASTLLVLLMIAQGAAMVPTAEARYLSAGITETCRISLFDIIEKNVELSADPTALRCALLFTLLGAWGGDKWQMDIAMGQRSMYLSMLKNAGMLEPQPSMVPNMSSPGRTELHWQSWLHRESQNRLVYNWVMVDQELSLFHDTSPVLSISDMHCPLPSPDILWMASSCEGWRTAVQSVYGCTMNVNPQLLSSPTLTPSLCELFQDFLHDNLARRKGTLTPQQLRLLLHPLQSLLCHLRQMLSCMSDVLPARRASNRTVTKASTMQRLEEVQAQLQHWYELSMAWSKENPDCTVTRCNLVLYHLISLNAVSSFPEIERLARREGFDGSYWELGLRYKRCIFQREEAIFHSGQVLRLLRQMPADRRPSWWSAALYRAVLILWADSICNLVDPRLKQGDSIPSTNAGNSTVSPGIPVPRAGSVSTPSVSGSITGSASVSGSISATGSASSPPSHSPGSRSNSTIAGTANKEASSLVAIDVLTPEDLEMIAYLWRGEGVAVLTRNDGVKFTLQNPREILDYGVKRIKEAVSTRVGDGLRRKLLALAGNWNLETLS